MSQDLLACLLVGLGGVALAGLTVWARRGRSKAARFWMPETLAGSWMLERCVLLGAPTFAAMMLDLAVLATVDTPPVKAAGAVFFVLLCVPTLYFLMAFLPIPRWLYPRWAREIKVWRTEANARLDAWLAQRRSQR